MMEKNDLVGDALKIMPPQYLPRLYRGELLKNDTSGSTGKCLEVYWTREDYMRSMYPLWFWRYKFYGIRPWDRLCRFYTISVDGEQEVPSRRTDKILYFSKNDLTEQRMFEIYQEMLEFEPEWLLLQPCMAELLLITKKKYELPSIASLRYIEMTGEELTDNLKERIRKEFCCPVADQYGANEVNSIAYECPQGNMHCMEDNVRVRIFDDVGNEVPEGTEGNIYVTTLHNHAMPFEDYGIGDIGCLMENHCTCGHKGRLLKLTSGRRTAWVYLEDGSRVTPYVFVRAVDCVNIRYDNCIIQFQVIQENYRKFTVRLVLDDSPEGMCEYLIRCIGDERLRDAEYSFEFHDRLLPDLNGKRSYFKTNVPKEKDDANNIGSGD